MIYQERTQVIITEGQYNGKQGVINKVYLDLADEPIYLISFSIFHSGQFTANQFKSIDMWGDRYDK